jgi:hypothetical protein
MPSVTSGGQAWRVIMTIKSDDAKTTKEKAIKTTPVLRSSLPIFFVMILFGWVDLTFINQVVWVNLTFTNALGYVVVERKFE